MSSRHQGGLSTLFRFTAPIMLCLLSAFICVQFTISEAWADNAKDTIVFTNGDRLSGKLSQATHESVKFVGDVTKVVTLQWTDIQEIDLGKRTLCVVGKATAGTGKPNNFKLDKAIIRVEGRYLTVTSGPDKHRFPIDDLLSAVPQVTSGSEPISKQSVMQGWGGTVQSQDTLTSSTQDQYQVGASVHVARATQSDKAFAYQITNVNLYGNYGEAKKPNASPVITQVYEGGVQEDVYITDNDDALGNRKYGGARLIGVVDFYHNLSLGLNLEQAYGFGLAWDGQSGKEGYGRQKYGLSADLRYIGEDLYVPGTAQKLAAANLGQNYQIRFTLVKGKSIILAENGSVIPAFNNSHALQARGVASFTVPITQNFSIGVQEVDDYLRNAPPKSKQNYSSLQFKVAYTFGAASQPK
jgi:hypothetical protein